jgi:osmoprotectant transport system substrate-binding protein
LRTRRVFAIAAIALALVAGACSSKKETAGSVTPKSGPTIVVGSSNFYESKILAEIYAQGLKAKGYNTAKKLNIGARELYFPALLKGTFNFFPEYTGSALVYLSKNPNASKPDSNANYTDLGTELKKKNLTAYKMANAQDQDGIVVNKATADKYNLKTLSDLKAAGPQLVMGGPPECPKRQACIKGLQDVYGVHFKQFKPLDTGGPLTVSALKNNAIQVANLFTTDPSIVANNFVLLEQDPGKIITGAENVVPIVRDSIAKTYGTDLAAAVNAITSKITTAGLTELNKQVVVDKKDPADVARTWLSNNGY